MNDDMKAFIAAILRQVVREVCERRGEPNTRWTGSVYYQANRVKLYGVGSSDPQFRLEVTNLLHKAFRDLGLHVYRETSSSRVSSIYVDMYPPRVRKPEPLPAGNYSAKVESVTQSGNQVRVVLGSITPVETVRKQQIKELRELAQAVINRCDFYLAR